MLYIQYMRQYILVSMLDYFINVMPSLVYINIIYKM